jgi:hypothetical protein
LLPSAWPASAEIGNRKDVEIKPSPGYKATKFEVSSTLQSVLNTSIDDILKSYWPGKIQAGGDRLRRSSTFAIQRS